MALVASELAVSELAKAMIVDDVWDPFGTPVQAQRTEVWCEFVQVVEVRDPERPWMYARAETRDEVYHRVWAEVLLLYRIYAQNYGVNVELRQAARAKLAPLMLRLALGSPESVDAWLCEDEHNDARLAERLAPTHLFTPIEQKTSDQERVTPRIVNRYGALVDDVTPPEIEAARKREVARWLTIKREVIAKATGERKPFAEWAADAEANR